MLLGLGVGAAPKNLAGKAVTKAHANEAHTALFFNAFTVASVIMGELHMSS